MPSESFTIEQYNALNRSIAQGTLTVTYGDKTVEYRSLDEMLRIRNLMMAELGLAKPGGRKLAAFSKNWKK
ncbi:MAG: hypothetical protein H3C36_01935 [Chitinophagaceae bacterium]|nr:hypothetical protein [Chitinophagaceae bacterium]